MRFCSWFQLYFGPYIRIQLRPALWGGEDSGALRHWHHKNSIECHYGQMQLFPPKICLVSSALQTDVVSSDGEFGRITAIHSIHLSGSWMFLDILLLVPIMAPWQGGMLPLPFWWRGEAQSLPEFQQGDSGIAGSRARKSLDNHRVRGKGFAEHSGDEQSEGQGCSEWQDALPNTQENEPGEPLLRGGL